MSKDVYAIMEISICQCTIEDLEEIITIGKETYIDTFHEYCTKEVMSEYIEEAFSIRKIEMELLNRYSEFYFIRNKESIVGYTKYNIEDAQTDFQKSEDLEIERIYVKERYKGKGLGYKLIQHAIERAKELHKEEIWLGVWEKNQGAIEFYRKCGFHIDGEHAFFMGNDRQNDYIMKRKV